MDPNYVRPVVQTKIGNGTKVYLKTHLCTEEDYVSFAPTSSSSKALFETYKKKNFLYCLNDEQSILIKGSLDTFNLNLALIVKSCLPTEN